MSQIHIHDRDANPDITFDDVLASFRVVMSHRLSADECEKFVDTARFQVPRYYSKVNNPPR